MKKPDERQSLPPTKLSIPMPRVKPRRREELIMFKVLIVVTRGDGIHSSIVEFPSKSDAEIAVSKVNSAHVNHCTQTATALFSKD